MNSKNNGKEEKSKGSGNPVLDALTEMLSVMSPEEKMQLMANLENIAQSESPLDDMLEDTYTFPFRIKSRKMQCVISLCAFLPEAYPIIFKAVVQMAVENPFCRLQVLGCAADVLKSCVEVTISAMAMNITSEDETLLKLLSLPKQN